MLSLKRFLTTRAKAARFRREVDEMTAAQGHHESNKAVVKAVIGSHLLPDRETDPIMERMRRGERFDRNALVRSSGQ